MDLSKAILPDDLKGILYAIYQEAQKINPEINESSFFERILREWLETYRKQKSNGIIRKDAVLKNRIEEAAKASGKSKTQIAGEIGINRTYLSQVIKGKYEPSVKVAFLMADAVNEKINNLFYLETVPNQE